jgi:hypothetical protein
MNIRQGHEWDRFEGLAIPPAQLEAFLRAVPFYAQGRRRLEAPAIRVPDTLPVPAGREVSTQHGFGQLLTDLRKATPSSPGASSPPPGRDGLDQSWRLGEPPLPVRP